jgi:anti-sigma-K factor RskA
MTTDDLHQLSAAYALDALDPGDRRAFEEHLADCDDCRAELASLGETVGALALAADGPAPPADLRDRIVSAARAEPPKVIALGPRRSRVYALTAVAAAAVVGLAIGLALALSGGGPSNQLALKLQPSGSSQLTARGFDRAPSGKVYEIWIIRNGRARPVAVFRGGDTHVVDMGKVPKGTVVAVTLERAPRASTPTTEPISKTAV